jgi:hypothetical protein
MTDPHEAESGDLFAPARHYYTRRLAGSAEQDWTAIPRGTADACVNCGARSEWQSSLGPLCQQCHIYGQELRHVAAPLNSYANQIECYDEPQDSRALAIAQKIDARERDAQYSFLLGMACGGLVVMGALPLTLWLIGALK